MSDRLRQAAEKLREVSEREFTEGYETAIQLILDDQLSLQEVERYSDYDSRDYVTIRKEREFIYQSNTFIEGFINGCLEALRTMRGS